SKVLRLCSVGYSKLRIFFLERRKKKMSGRTIRSARNSFTRQAHAAPFDRHSKGARDQFDRMIVNPIDERTTTKPHHVQEYMGRLRLALGVMGEGSDLLNNIKYDW